MGLGWHVVLESGAALPAADLALGKSLIFHQRELDELARALGLTPLTAYVCAVPGRVAEYLREQGLDPEQFPIDEEEWFPAAEGLASVHGLLSHVRARPEAVADPVRVLRDLEALERGLQTAAAAAVRFHLASELPRGLAE